MIYGIIGPRDFNGKEYDNYDHIEGLLNTFTIDKIISGGSKGVEKLVEEYSDNMNIEYEVVRPNIQLHGHRSAFFIRNSEIIKASQSMIVFWDGATQGIVDVLSNTVRAGKRVNLVPMSI